MSKLSNPLKHLKKNYGNTASIVSFLSPYKIYKFYNGKLKMKQILDFLSTSESYTLMKQEKKAKFFNDTITYHWRDLIQADLFYTDRLSSENDGIRYILTLIDCHTKFAFCEALLDKKGQTITSKLKSIFNRIDNIPKVFCSDRGSEFNCKETRKFLQNQKVKIFYARGDSKASVVERFQKTFQTLIYKFLVEHETYRYIDALQTLIKNYNETYHISIKMSPAEAENPLNWDKLASVHSEQQSRMRVKKINPAFKKGDIVRITLLKTPFTRSYNISHSYQRYIIHEVHTSRLIPSYTIKEENGHILDGKFYNNQLTKVNIPNYRGRVIKTRIKNGKTEYLMTFTGYNSEYDLWVPESNLNKIK